MSLTSYRAAPPRVGCLCMDRGFGFPDPLCGVGPDYLWASGWRPAAWAAPPRVGIFFASIAGGNLRSLGFRPFGRRPLALPRTLSLQELYETDPKATPLASATARRTNWSALSKACPKGLCVSAINLIL